MTRIAVLGVLVLAAAGRAPADDQKDVPKELAPFQGTWKVVRCEEGGKALPEKEAAAMRFVFNGARVLMHEGETKALEGDPFTLDPKKEPAQLVVTPKGEDEVRIIYKFDKDGRLTLCFNNGKGETPREFKSPPKTDIVLVVLERVKE
jgi:uncharacterized protein (TIGR03067 family)